MEKFVFIVTPFKLKILDQLIKYHMMSPALPFVEAKKIQIFFRFRSQTEQNLMTFKYHFSGHFVNKISNFFGVPEHALDAYNFAGKRKFLTLYNFQGI